MKFFPSKQSCIFTKTTEIICQRYFCIFTARIKIAESHLWKLREKVQFSSPALFLRKCRLDVFWERHLMIRLKTQHANQPKVIILTLAFVISLSDLFLISHSQPKLLIETHYKTRHRRYNQILIWRQNALVISDLRDLWWKMSRGTQDLEIYEQFIDFWRFYKYYFHSYDEQIRSLMKTTLLSFACFYQQ